MAIYAGVARPEQIPAIWDRILRPGSPAWDQVATPYYDNYVIYAMGMSGHTDETLNFIRSYWGGMLDEGATTWWEGYDPRWSKRDFHAHLQADNGTGYFVSLCHGWSAGPTSWLTERVLGVNPTGGGFKTVRISPSLGSLAWAQGTIPTPTGSLKIRVERKGEQLQIRLVLPKGLDATIPVPGAASVNDQLITTQKGDVHLSAAGTYRIAYHS